MNQSDIFAFCTDIIAAGRNTQTFCAKCTIVDAENWAIMRFTWSTSVLTFVTTTKVGGVYNKKLTFL